MKEKLSISLQYRLRPYREQMQDSMAKFGEKKIEPKENTSLSNEYGATSDIL